MLAPATRTLAFIGIGSLVSLLACTESEPQHPNDGATALDAGRDGAVEPRPRDAGRDATVEPQPSDAGRDATVEAGGASCEQKQETFDQFVSAHRGCSEDDDCEVIGDCGPNADFVAVRADAAEEAYALMQARCSGAYDGPMYAARCESGRCTTEMRTDACCGCPWHEDAGADDAGQ